MCILSIKLEKLNYKRSNVSTINTDKCILFGVFKMTARIIIKYSYNNKVIVS
jgi:hypothetical protein